MKLIRLAAAGTALDGAAAAQDPVAVTNVLPFAAGYNGIGVVTFVGGTGTPVVKIQATDAEDPEDVAAVWTDLMATSGVLAQQFVDNIALPQGCTGVRANKTAGGAAGDYDAYILLSD